MVGCWEGYEPGSLTDNDENEDNDDEDNYDCESSSECGESEYCMETEFFGEVVSKTCEGTSLRSIYAMAHSGGWFLWRPFTINLPFSNFFYLEWL